jgi:hypothetical protein
MAGRHEKPESLAQRSQSFGNTRKSAGRRRRYRHSYQGLTTRGLDVTCIEPGPRMPALLARTRERAASPHRSGNLRVNQSRRQYDGLVSAAVDRPGLSHGPRRAVVAAPLLAGPEPEARIGFTAVITRPTGNMMRSRSLPYQSGASSSRSRSISSPSWKRPSLPRSYWRITPTRRRPALA